jgi:hypothetical protein
MPPRRRAGGERETSPQMGGGGWHTTRTHIHRPCGREMAAIYSSFTRTRLQVVQRPKAAQPTSARRARRTTGTRAHPRRRGRDGAGRRRPDERVSALKTHAHPNAHSTPTAPQALGTLAAFAPLPYSPHRDPQVFSPPGPLHQQRTPGCARGGPFLHAKGAARPGRTDLKRIKSLHTSCTARKCS